MSKSVIGKDHLPGLRSIGLVVVLAGILLWAIWVTVRLTQPEEQKIVQVRMSEIMHEFVDTNAKDDADPEAMRKAIARHLKATEAAVGDLSRSGNVILVAEAVLSKNTPDATLKLKSMIAAKQKNAEAETAR